MPIPRGRQLGPDDATASSEDEVQGVIPDTDGDGLNEPGRRHRHRRRRGGHRRHRHRPGALTPNPPGFCSRWGRSARATPSCGCGCPGSSCSASRRGPAAASSRAGFLAAAPAQGRAPSAVELRLEWLEDLEYVFGTPAEYTLDAVITLELTSGDHVYTGSHDGSAANEGDDDVVVKSRPFSTNTLCDTIDGAVESDVIRVEVATVGEYLDDSRATASFPGVVVDYSTDAVQLIY